MKATVKITSHAQAVSRLVGYLGKSRFLTLRTELSKCRTLKVCLRYAYFCGDLAGFSGRVLAHALVREAMAHKAITHQVSDLLHEGIVNPQPQWQAERQKQADKLTKALLSPSPLFAK